MDDVDLIGGGDNRHERPIDLATNMENRRTGAQQEVDT